MSTVESSRSNFGPRFVFDGEKKNLSLCSKRGSKKKGSKKGRSKSKNSTDSRKSKRETKKTGSKSSSKSRRSNGSSSRSVSSKKTNSRCKKTDKEEAKIEGDECYVRNREALLRNLKLMRHKIERDSGNVKDMLSAARNSLATTNKKNCRTTSTISKTLNKTEMEMSEENRESSQHLAMVQKMVDATLDKYREVERLKKRMAPLKKNVKDRQKTALFLKSARIAAEELVKFLVRGQNNISYIQIHGINHNQVNGSLFSELSSALFESNEVLHSLRQLAPKIFGNESAVGKLVLDTEKLSFAVTFSLRHVLQDPDPVTVSSTTRTTETRTEQSARTESTQGDIKLDSAATPNFSFGTSTMKTTILSNGAKTNANDLSFRSQNSSYRKATSTSNVSLLTNSEANASFSEAELVEHFRRKENKSDEPEKDVVTAKSIKQKK